jgi:hypothetical protein
LGGKYAGYLLQYYIISQYSGIISYNGIYVYSTAAGTK